MDAVRDKQRKEEGKMKKLLRLGICLMVMVLTLVPTFVQAFNSATHLYIAEHVFPDLDQKNDLYYGSIAPDLALFVTEPEKWPTAFDDTHYDYIDLRANAWSPTRMAFAKGWLTHNELWGADYFAHIEYPPGGGTGYVIDKANELIMALGWEETDQNTEFAHYAIEVTIDLLLKKDDFKLGQKLVIAVLLRSWEDRVLLKKVLVRKQRRTDRRTLAGAELTFRNLSYWYARALASPPPWDRLAVAKLGSHLALEMYGIEISPEELLKILYVAIQICKPDYKDVIDYAIEQIRSNR